MTAASLPEKLERSPLHDRLRLRNFTCFQDQTFEFVENVNVFVGENGTGKTHVMKALYAFQKKQATRRNLPLDQVLRELFQIDTTSELISKGSGECANAVIAGVYGTHDWQIDIPRVPLQGAVKDMKIIQPRPEQPVFIPAMDMIGHTKGLLESANREELDFDSTCLDLVSYLGSKRKATLRERQEVEAKLREVVTGDIEQDETKRFYLVTEQGRFPMPMVAEGIRKVATLRKLVENNWITQGATLFWDEPEVNLNPKIMDEVVEALLMISRRGVQVFLASHSYVILKELEVKQIPGDKVRYFAFACSENGTTVQPADTYLDLYPNAIEEQYASLYNESIQKEIERLEEEAPHA